jgi:hypothetical protein
MESGPDLPSAADNPGALADAEQHARQEIAGLRSRAAGAARGAAGYAWPVAAAASGVILSGWLLRRWRRKH